MPSPVPKHLRTPDEERGVPSSLREHVTGLVVSSATVTVEPCPHPAKYAPGLPTALVALAGTNDLADPMAGSGRLASETGLAIRLNEPDERWLPWLRRCSGARLAHCDARKLPKWFVADTMIFSPPYYPRTDRCRVAAHDDVKRGPVVGYRSGYSYTKDGMIGDPNGADGILEYRSQMRAVYAALRVRARRMILIVKNQTRLGVELRLDLDTILTATEVGWRCTRRTGWEPPPSLWARYNLARGTGVAVEDVLLFEAEREESP